MPWKVVKDSRCPVGKPYAVVSTTTNKVHGCHATTKEARDQQKALYANVPESRM